MSGIPSAAVRSLTIMRPLYQVISRKNSNAPMPSGSQPPSSTFSRLAPKKPRSTVMNTPMISATSSLFQFHTFTITTQASTVVITMVAVTAIPYAAARLSELLNAITMHRMMNSSIQFTTGT